MKEVRWRKYGHDRTYFKTDDGQDLGWIDNLTGKRHGFMGPGLYDSGRSSGHSGAGPRAAYRAGNVRRRSRHQSSQVSLPGAGAIRYILKLAVVAVAALIVFAVAYSSLMNAGKILTHSTSSPAPNAGTTP